MRYHRIALMLLAAIVLAKKKHRHQKPGRALLDHLNGEQVGDVSATSGARSDGVLLPAPLDIAPYAAITANATCGDNGAEEYCRDTPGKRGVACDVCEGLDGPPSRRHPPTHAIDGDPSTWWQSPSLASGDFSYVELVARLADKMELLHVIIKAGPSPRPLAWSLEVSSTDTGEDWRMVRAFGDRDHCRKLWDLRPERRRRKARAAKRTNRADKPTCSTQFVSPKPLENGEMHVGLGEGVTARRVRIAFRAAHPAPARHQYYTVRAFTLAARCLCHGHATHCLVDHQGAKCDCQHGTCGIHCQRCCSGLPWEPHKPCDVGDKTGCSCGERGACSYDDTGAILCVNCTENRAGPLCDRCLIGYYNVLPDGPCQPCNCDPEGSDGSCKWNRKHHALSCACFPGFAGLLCDTCEDPSATFPNCQAPTTPACKCDSRGIVDPTKVCDEVCECKANVVGERCDACAPGHFGLDAGFPGGCTQCYCSHITDSCTLAPDGTDPPQDVIFPMDAWMVTDSLGNQTVEPSVDDRGKPFLISYEVEGWELYYWVTQSWSGEQLTAYGAEIRASMFWGVVRGDTGGNPTEGPDFILVAADGTKLACANTSHEQPGQVTITAALLEESWYTVGEESAEPATRTQLMDVLRDLKALMLRAHFHFDQDEVRLEGVEVVSPAGGGGPREVCACPAGYGGAQCTRCGWEHVRVQHARTTTPPFECVPCACNGHAACSTVDGPCGECQHNTTGPHCERCLPGHYGNPVQGACKPCACPLYLPSNNFSPNCALASAEGDEFVCTQCPDGYTGDHCEHCDFGYWGSPTTLGSSCQACACGGSPCHPDTGLCLTCPPHTEGARCDQCEEGYWFGESAVISGAPVSCEPCACGAGALAAACDARTGQCACREGFAGRACDTCQQGHGGIATGCPRCHCGTAAINNECIPLTGECACAPGAAPPSCDICMDEHYGLDVTGCLGCNCSKLGAESNACDIRTGQCRCKPHVTGRTCDTCEEGYWGLQHGGCRRCECGAGAAACDPVSGMCACAAGVGGAQCDACLPGYYGFGPAGCLPCSKCSDGKVCSPESGRCVCPPRSRGPGCKQCAPGYHITASGCRPCRCGAGAISNHCDPLSGQCKCKAGWIGTECDVCARGHFGPRCRPCMCNIAGSRHCEGGLCPCDAGGRCPCKENVVGDKCEECLSGTFGLSADNPSGCTACFCFGRAAHCTQASLTRAALHAATPHHITLIQGDRNMSVDEESLVALPTDRTDSIIPLPWPPVPVYIELDRRFLGDRVTSYGGALRFTVEEEGGEELPAETMARFPLVRVEGNGIVLNHYQRSPSLNGTYSARFHESLWEIRGHAALATRGVLMATLQTVSRVLLRVTTRSPTYHDRVHALLLNVSLDTAIPGLSRTAPALGVELCDCTRGYSAPSCQEPAIGFWMPPQRYNVHSAAGTILIDVEGAARPCQCNNRADACDPNTGDCLNCTLGTGGPQCASCAEGYFGEPEEGCQPCPCPSRAANYATSCALTAGRLQCLCKPGYTGPECEWCASGWFRAAGGACQPCDCDRRGAVSQHCDTTGKCRCREFADGDRCDRCVARRAYMDDTGECQACDNCTQTLLDSVEQLAYDLRARADLTELNRIPQPFPALLEFAHNTTQLQSRLDGLKEDIDNSHNLAPSIYELEDRQHKLFTEANKLKTEAAKKGEQAHYLSLESMSGLDEVLKQRRILGERVANLDDFARGEKHLSAHRALKEARHLLKHIKDVQLVDFLSGANDVFDSATLQSTAVQEYDYRIEDIQKRLHKLIKGLDDWERKSEDLQRLGDVVWSAGDTVAAVEKSVKPKLASIKDTALRCRLMLEDISSLSSNNLTDEAGLSILRGQTLAIKFPGLLAEMKNLTMAAEEKEGILYNLTPAYREKYLVPVEGHVVELNEKAKQYKMVFAGTRAAASLGVSAATAWTAVADAVKDAATAADAARAAAAAAGATFNKDSMPDASSGGIHASSELKRRGAELLARSEELRERLESLHRAADVVSVSLRALGWSERALAERPHARVADTLHDASAQADRVFGTMRALYDEAGELRRRARYNLRRQLAELQRHGDTQLGAAQEHVSQIRGNTIRGAELADALAAAAAARAREHSSASNKLDPSLSSLKDLIARAKHAAQSISVSVTSRPGGSVGCTRAYALPTSSLAITKLAIAVSFDNDVKDGPLLNLVDENQDKEKYMRLSVEKRKLKLRWNLGAGEALIAHPETLQPAHDDADQTTYKIEIERIWNTVNLRLERMGGATPVLASNTSSASAVQLAASRLWLGGNGGLTGCVHALHHDDHSIGLWSFSHQPDGAECAGCTQRWYSGSRSSTPSLVWFNGAGYAELRRSGLRPADRRQFSVSFTFRTRDENALLFMALDKANNRSVSIVMRSCRVVFLVQYNEARLEIAAGGRHCDGRPAHLQAIRAFGNNKLERGSLRVNGEETLGSAAPPVQSAAALPDLSGAAYWVGGLPPGAGTGPGPDAAPPDALGLRPLMGCIGALMVDREGYNLLDTPTRHGVEPTCEHRTFRSAVLEGAGYIELPSPSLRRKGALGMTFRARAPDGLLLYRAPAIENDTDEDVDADDKHYLAVLLVQGDLQVVAAAGKAELRLRTNGTKFDDGRLHSIRIVRAHKQLELWADEERKASGTLAGNAYAARTRGLFVGGISPELGTNLTRPAITATGFTGTVADLIIDSQLIGLESAVGWRGAQLGRADSEPRAEPHAEPRALQAQPGDDAGCSKTTSYTVEAGAVKFGDAPWSHAAVRLPARARELQVSLQFRTFRPDGLLLLVPGSKAKPKHYLALVMREGRLRLVVRGRKRRELSLPAPVADGTWRPVTIRVTRTRLSLSSGGAAAHAHAPALARAHRLYVGGLPAPPAPRTLPNSITRLGGLIGCVRRVSVNGRGEDLVRDHHAVGQCFPAVEQAAFFAGDAYATWTSSWAAGPESGTEAGAEDDAETEAGAGAGAGAGETEVRLQFRSGEPNGVLLASKHMLLELKDGLVVLTRYWWRGEEAARVSVPARACDGRWHEVRVRGAALSLDAGPELRPAPPPLHIDAPDPPASTPAPLYIGGLPEGTAEWGDGAGGRENFKGCIRHVRAGAHALDWSRLHHAHHVLLDSCPVAR